MMCPKYVDRSQSDFYFIPASGSTTYMSIQIQVTEKYSTASVLVVMVMLVMIEANR